MLRKLILKPNRPPITSPSLIRLFSEELNLTPPTCYYKTLNLSTNATFDSIKSSYLSLAKKYHPDISQAPNSKEKFQQVAEAYKMLSKPENRQKYDFSIGIKQPKWHFDENLEDEFENQEEFMKYVKGEKDFENEKYNIDYSFEEEKSEELYDYFRYKYLGRFREKKGEVGELSKFRDMVDEANTVDERNPLKFSPKIKEKWEEVKKERIEKNEDILFKGIGDSNPYYEKRQVHEANKNIPKVLLSEFKYAILGLALLAAFFSYQAQFRTKRASDFNEGRKKRKRITEGEGLKNKKLPI